MQIETRPFDLRMRRLNVAIIAKIGGWASPNVNRGGISKA